MKLFKSFFRSRDKPKDITVGTGWFHVGRSWAGKSVTERTAMQQTAVYACVRIISETIASLPLHLYKYTDAGKEKDYTHPLYYLLHDEPNNEMTAFVFGIDNKINSPKNEKSLKSKGFLLYQHYC